MDNIVIFLTSMIVYIGIWLVEIAERNYQERISAIKRVWGLSMGFRYPPTDLQYTIRAQRGEKKR